MRSVEAHRALVERLEREAVLTPVRYKWKVGLLAALGFAVLGGTVLLAFGSSVGLVVLLAAVSPVLLLKLAKVLWIPVAVGWLVLRALWVKFEPPAGRRLGPGDAPQLHAEVERLRKGAGAPALAGIIVDSDFNAAAASVPRALGLLGHRHYLVVGLPLMQALSREQFLAVLAHEFGHFGGGHGRFTGWIYHVRVSWFRLLDAMSARGGWFADRFVSFFQWYAPYFNAYSFVLSRANEYQADATAARLVSPEAMGTALVRTQLGGDRLSRDFWPSITRLTRSQPSPPDALYSRMRHCLLSPGQGDDKGLAQALALEPGLDDTHPSLSQRLAALGQSPAIAPVPSVSAADALLGPALAQRLEEEFSGQWQQDVEQGWTTRHEEHAFANQRLAQLRSVTALSPPEAVELARLVEEVEPETDPLPAYRSALEIASDDAFAQYRAGVLLLERGDASGVAHLERALKIEPQSSETILGELHAHFARSGDARGLRDVEQRLHQFRSMQRRAMQARGDLGLRDAFEPHALDAETLRAAMRSLEAHGSVKKAWIVRKKIPAGASSVPHFVVLVQWRGLLLRSEQGSLERLAEALDLPGSLIVVSWNSRPLVGSRIRKAAGRPTYQHSMAL